MIATIIFMLQSATPQPASLNDVEDAAQPKPAAEQVERKRVCRIEMDTRVGLIPKRRKICRFADGMPGTPSQD